MAVGHVTTSETLRNEGSNEEEEELRSDKAPPSSYEGLRNEALISRDGGGLERSMARRATCDRREPQPPPSFARCRRDLPER